MDALGKQRLKDLEETLSLLYEQRKTHEQEMVVSASAAQKSESKMRLKREILPQIAQHEAEYAQLLAESHAPEAEAQVIVGEIVRTISEVETDLRADERFEEMMDVLRQIQDRLNAPGKTATGKLKVELPILPKLVKYEMEVEAKAALGVLKGLRERAFRLFRKALADPR
jgi:hypothetical protein